MQMGLRTLLVLTVTKFKFLEFTMEQTLIATTEPMLVNQCVEQMRIHIKKEKFTFANASRATVKQSTDVHHVHQSLQLKTLLRVQLLEWQRQANCLILARQRKAVNVFTMLVQMDQVFANVHLDSFSPPTNSTSTTRPLLASIRPMLSVLAPTRPSVAVD